MIRLVEIFDYFVRPSVGFVTLEKQISALNILVKSVISYFPISAMDKHWILVAEDNPIIRRILLAILEPEGHHLLVARDGLHALNLSREHAGAIDLLVTNVNMPEMSGHELARQIRQTRPGIRVIVVSGDHEKDFPPDAQDYNIAILKPIDPKLLISKVRQLLPAKAS